MARKRKIRRKSERSEVVPIVQIAAGSDGELYALGADGLVYEYTIRDTEDGDEQGMWMPLSTISEENIYDPNVEEDEDEEGES